MGAELLFKPFDLSKVQEESEKEDSKPVTFWIKKSAKLKYEMIQEKSKNKYGKHIIEGLTEFIEKTEV